MCGSNRHISSFQELNPFPYSLFANSNDVGELCVHSGKGNKLDYCGFSSSARSLFSKDHKHYGNKLILANDIHLPEP